MEFKSGDVHILNCFGCIQGSELNSQSFLMRSLYPGCSPCLIKSAQSLVPERIDHEGNIACCALRNKYGMLHNVSSQSRGGAASIWRRLLCLLSRFLEFFSYYFPECIFQAFIMRINIFS